MIGRFAMIKIHGNEDSEKPIVWAKAGIIILLLLLNLLYFQSCIIVPSSGNKIERSEYVGVVLDSTTNMPIPGAGVLWLQQELEVRTDLEGKFILPAIIPAPVTVGSKNRISRFVLPSNQYTIVFKHPEYEEQRIERFREKDKRGKIDLGTVFLDPK